MQPTISKLLTLFRWVGVATSLALAVACSSNSQQQTEEEEDASTRSSSDSDEESPCPGVESEDRSKVVAKVGSESITVCDVTEALNKMSPYLRKAYEAPEKRQQFLDNMIRFELIAQEAQRRGYDDDDEVQRVRKQMMIQRLNKQLQESIRLSDITEEEMREYYEEHEDDYHKAEMVRIARVVTKTAPEAQRVLKQAQSKANDSRYFRQLAREHSIDEQTREHGGDLPYFSRVEDRSEDAPEIDETVVEAAFSLDMRDPLYSKVIETEDGFNVIRLRGRRKARDLSFDDVKRQIRHRLHRDKLRTARDELVSKLREEADIEINEEELAEVEIEVPENLPTRPGRGLRPAPSKAQEKAPAKARGKAPAKARGKAPAKARGKAPAKARGKAPAKAPTKSEG